MKGLLLDAKWDPRPSYELSDFEKRTGKAVEGLNTFRMPEKCLTLQMAGNILVVTFVKCRFCR